MISLNAMKNGNKTEKENSTHGNVLKHLCVFIKTTKTRVNMSGFISL